MDYSDTVIVVVTTISAFIIALLLAFLYYIQCIRSRPPSDKNNAIGLDWVKINNLMALKSPAKSFKETTSPDHSEYIYNPSIPNINNTNDNSSSGKSIATSIDVEFGTRYASITSPPHGSSKGSSNTSKISLAVTETKPVNNNKNQSTSSSSASIDNFGSFQFLDPSFASVVSGKSTELDSVLPTPPSSSSSVSTATTTTATNQVRSPPKHEVEVRDSTALTWSRDALLPSVPTISPTPVTTHIITPTVTQPEEDSASVTVPQTENEETPALTETEFNDAMTSKLMPPSAEGPQKFTSGGLIAADIQMSVATNKGLTAAERNTEYFKKIKEVSY